MDNNELKLVLAGWQAALEQRDALDKLCTSLKQSLKDAQADSERWLNEIRRLRQEIAELKGYPPGVSAARWEAMTGIFEQPYDADVFKAVKNFVIAYPDACTHPKLLAWVKKHNKELLKEIL